MTCGNVATPNPDIDRWDDPILKSCGVYCWSGSIPQCNKLLHEQWTIHDPFCLYNFIYVCINPTTCFKYFCSFIYPCNYVPTQKQHRSDHYLLKLLCWWLPLIVAVCLNSLFVLACTYLFITITCVYCTMIGVFNPCEHNPCQFWTSLSPSCCCVSLRLVRHAKMSLARQLYIIRDDQAVRYHKKDWNRKLLTPPARSSLAICASNLISNPNVGCKHLNISGFNSLNVSYDQTWIVSRASPIWSQYH